MATTYELIESASVGAGGSAYMEFTSIPSTYTDLIVKVSGRSARTGTNADNLNITFNGSTSNYSGRVVYGDGAGVASYSQATSYILGEIPTANTTSNIFGNFEIYIANYASNKNKSVFVNSATENNSGGSGSAYLDLIAGLWSNTTAITSIKVASQVNNFVQYSTAYLYGVKNA